LIQDNSLSGVAISALGPFFFSGSAMDFVSTGLISFTNVWLGGTPSRTPLTIDLNTSVITFNDDGLEDGDVRMESDTEENMFLLDASTELLHFGGTTNGVSIGKGGEVRLNGSATVFDDELPTTYIQLTGGAAPNITLVGGSGNLRAQEFANSSASEEYLPIWQFSHARKPDSAVMPHLHLYVPNDGTGGNIVFGMYFVWSNINDTSITEVGPVYATLTRAANAGINANAIISWAAIDGTGKGFSSILRARIFRVQGGTDTFGGTCWLLSGDCHIEKDKLGTNNEYS
jgi:hypothetical protein